MKKSFKQEKYINNISNLEMKYSLFDGICIMQHFEKRKRSKKNDFMCSFSFENLFNMRIKQNPMLISFSF